MKFLLCLALTVPALAVTDDFNRANGSLGANWTAATGSWAVVSNKASQSTTFDASRSGFLAVWTPSNASVVQATIAKPAANRTNGVVLGYSSSGGSVRYWVAYARTLALQPDEIRLYRYEGTSTSGTFTQVGATYRAELSDEIGLRLSASGSTLTVSQWDGSAWTTRLSGTDASYATGLAGLRATDSSWFDDFSITAAAGSGSAPDDVTGLQISDVVGLTDALASKPTKAIGWTAGRAAVIDEAGAITAASGTSSDCVKVDGSSGACGSAGSVETADAMIVSYSATPTFTIPSGSLSASFTITLSGNVTSSELDGRVPGQRVHFRVCEDGVGNRTFAWPTTVIGFPTVYPLAGSCTTQTGVVNAAGNVIPDAQGLITDIGSYGQFRGCVAGLPPPPPPAGTLLLYCKLADLSFHVLRSDGTDITLGAAAAGATSLARDAVIDKGSYQLREDFTTSASAFGASVPPYPFSHIPLAGSPTFLVIAPEANHPGIVRLTTGSASSDSSYWWTRGANYTDAFPRLDNVTGWWMRWIFRLNSTSNVLLRIGLTDQDPFGSTINNGVALRFNTASDTKYQFESIAAGSVSATDSGVTPNSSTWVTLDIYSDVAGTVQFQINGGTAVSKSYSGSVGLSLGMLFKTLSASTKSVDTDLVALFIPVTR